MEENKKQYIYDEVENDINRTNQNIILNPKYIPVHPVLLRMGYTPIDCLIYGFIDFFLNTNSKFYCTNEQLWKMLNIWELAVTRSIKKLREDWLIETTYIIRSWWGKTRFIKLLKTIDSILWEQKWEDSKIREEEVEEIKVEQKEEEEKVVVEKKEEEREEDDDKPIKSRKKRERSKNEDKVVERKKYWEYVELSDEEYNSLVYKFWESHFQEVWRWDCHAVNVINSLVVDSMIETMNDYCKRHNKKYKSYYEALTNRLRKDRKYAYGSWKSLQEIHDHLETDQTWHLKYRYKVEFWNDAYDRIRKTVGHIDTDFPATLYDDYVLVVWDKYMFHRDYVDKNFIPS